MVHDNRSLIMHPNFSILEGFWDGLHIKYVHSENANASGTLKAMSTTGYTYGKALTMYVANTENFQADWLNYIPKRDYLLISLTPSLLKQLFGQVIPISHPPFIYQIEIYNRSIKFTQTYPQVDIIGQTEGIAVKSSSPEGFTPSLPDGA